MGLLTCRACDAKDKEIARLVTQLTRLTEMVEKAQTRLAELADPGVAMRLASAESRGKFEPKKPEPRRMLRGFPGYAPEAARTQIEIEDPFPIPSEPEGEGA